MGLKSKSENIVIWLFIFESVMKWKKAFLSICLELRMLNSRRRSKMQSLEKKGCVRLNWILIFDKSGLWKCRYWQDVCPGTTHQFDYRLIEHWSCVVPPLWWIFSFSSVLLGCFSASIITSWCIKIHVVL